MSKSKVSIIIRTCGRPNVLKHALDSIRNQSYSNIETIVVEDGSNKSESYIKDNYNDLNIFYFYVKEKSGRCRTGNIGLEKSSGDYINFLDDDDILLPNHIEMLVDEIEKKHYLVAYSIAEEHQIKIKNIETYDFIVKRKLIRYKQPYNKMLLFYMNYIPIQCIMFNRTLYEQYGGFDEKLNFLEDWDIWVRYSTKCDFLFLPFVTSIYYTPFRSKEKNKRDVEMKKAASTVIEKHKQYQISLSVEQINNDLDYLLNVYNKKGFVFYMQKVRNYLLYRDR